MESESYHIQLATITSFDNNRISQQPLVSNGEQNQPHDNNFHLMIIDIDTNAGA